MSWVTPVIKELQGDQAATAHKTSFFRNGAKPGMVISFKESVTPEQFKQFKATMDAGHQGVDQAYKTLYVGGGADVTVAGADLRQLDFRATQGAGETRLCAAGGVPPIIVGLSEGLQAATYSNYASARRKFGDHWARPQWRSACAALANIVDVPGGAELWYDDRDIAFLREDQKDAAEIAQMRASTINVYITAGFTAESSVAAVDADDVTLLVHSGMVSVQLQAPGAGVPEVDPALAGETPTEEVLEGELVAGELEAA
jgi:phage portal protein BeeE